MGIGLDLPGTIAIIALLILCVFLVWRVPHLSPGAKGPLTAVSRVLDRFASAVRGVWGRHR